MQQLQAVMRDGAQLASAGWVRLQHRLIVWKLAGYQRRYGSDRMVAGAPLPAQFSTPPSFVDLFSAAAVHRQLTRRYDYEMRQGAKPAVRRLLEGTLSSRAHMVLCVSAVDEARGALELTDGWYCVWASCDEPLQAQLERRRLFVGLKLRVCGCTEPSAIEERRKKSGDAAASLQAWELCGAPDAPRIELRKRHAAGGVGYSSASSRAARPSASASTRCSQAAAARQLYTSLSRACSALSSLSRARRRGG